MVTHLEVGGDALSDGVEHAGSVHSHDVWRRRCRLQLLGPSTVAGVGVSGVDGGGVDADHHLTFARLRIRHIYDLKRLRTTKFLDPYSAQLAQLLVQEGHD